VSSVIAFHRNGGYMFNGKLTIKGHTKDISFPFNATVVDGGYRFRGSFSINRRDFEVGGSSTISDRTDINLDVTVK
jgi:polyisoprenoid-binding protein YceI